MICTEIPETFPGNTVLLVKKCDRLFPKGAQLFQGLIYDMHLHLRLGIGLIYHMNDVVRIFGFFQGTLEGFYQIVGKLPDKSYSIRKKKLLSVIQCQKTCGRIQRGKKLILRKHRRTGQCIQKRGFSRIGVADNSRSLQISCRSSGTEQFPVLFHLGKFLLQCGDPVSDQTAVCLQFLLTGTSGTDSSSKP